MSYSYFRVNKNIMSLHFAKLSIAQSAQVFRMIETEIYHLHMIS